MTNTTTKTTASIFLALSVSLAMGVASATSVPGIGSGTFEFSKPGVGPTDIIATGNGHDAIANINNILDAVGGTGGSVLNQDNFWGSAVAKTQVDVFEYDAAAPMIEELIFLVKGEAFGRRVGDATADWHDAADIPTGTVHDASTAKADFLVKASNSSTGLYLDGKLSHSKARAMELMRLLNFTAADQSLTWTSDNKIDVNSSDPVTFSGPNDLIDASLVTNGTLATQGDVDAALLLNTNSTLAVGDSMRDSTIELAVAAASLNKQAFVNANELVELISNELKTGYILDVAKATANLAAIADHHTGFLSASLVHEAHGLKAMIKNVGYLEAAVGVGKGAKSACVDSGGATQKGIETCTKIGEEFKSLASKVVDVAGAATMADGYNSALANINAFADNIINFNGTVNGFNAADEAAAISEQFGTITVDTNSTLYGQLEADDAARLAGTADYVNTAPELDDISGLGLDVAEDIDGIFWTGLDLDNLDNDNDNRTGWDIVVK